MITSSIASNNVGCLSCKGEGALIGERLDVREQSHYVKKITVVFASSSFPSRVWFGEKYFQGKKRYPVKLRAYRRRHYRCIPVSPTTSDSLKQALLVLRSFFRLLLCLGFSFSSRLVVLVGVGPVEVDRSIVEVGRFLGSGGEGRQGRCRQRSVLDCAITAGSGFLRQVKRAFTLLRIRILCMAVVASGALTGAHSSGSVDASRARRDCNDLNIWNSSRSVCLVAARCWRQAYCRRSRGARSVAGVRHGQLPGS